MHLKGKPVDKLDLKKVAAKTKDYSGADLGAIVDSAVEAKLREALKTGKPTPLNTQDLLNALKSRRPTTHDWFATARNHALYSNESGEYDSILQYLGVKR